MLELYPGATLYHTLCDKHRPRKRARKSSGGVSDDTATAVAPSDTDSVVLGHSTDPGPGSGGAGTGADQLDTALALGLAALKARSNPGVPWDPPLMEWWEVVHDQAPRREAPQGHAPRRQAGHVPVPRRDPALPRKPFETLLKRHKRKKTAERLMAIAGWCRLLVQVPTQLKPVCRLR